MRPRGLQELLGRSRFFAGLPDEALEFLAGCAVNERLPAGRVLFRVGQAADDFSVVRSGRIALEIDVPGPGRIVVETLEEGDILGVSGLMPPYRREFDARTVVDSAVLRFDATCIRDKLDADPSLGYEVMKRLSAVQHRRLQSARLRLLDLYGRSGGADS